MHNDSSSMPSGPTLPTLFAPAERETPDRIAAQSAALHELPLMTAIVNAIPTPLLVLNRQRQIVFANQALYDALDTTPEAALGLRPGELLGCIHVLNAGPSGCGTTAFCRTCGAVQTILESLDGHYATRECRIRQAGGAALDLRVWGTPVRVQGEIFSIFAMHNIGHEKRRMALESIFFHDVLNLAGVLLGYSTLLETVNDSTDVQRIQGSLSRAAHQLVEEIKLQRDLSAAENGELRVHHSIIDAHRLLRRIVDFYQGHEIAAERTLRIAPEAGKVAFISDALLLERVIGNMIKNALEASDPGETVTVSCHVHDASIEFTVHNAAVMPADVRLQVFQRSFSTKGQRRGLGTYSMKLLGEQYLGGTVTFESEPGQGTVFRVCIPLERPND